VQIVTKKVGRVFEADIRSYFTRINHQWLRKMVAHRIADPVILGLIGKWLKAGAMQDGVVIYAEEGTPQGGPITPRTQKINLNLSGRSSLQGGSGIANDTPSSLDMCLLRLYLYVVCLVPLRLNGRSASIAPEPCFRFVHPSPKPFNSSSDRAPFLHVRLIDISSRPNL
jgi:hypothetical protein